MQFKTAKINEKEVKRERGGEEREREKRKTA